jgi:hypothetical protein
LLTLSEKDNAPMGSFNGAWGHSFHLFDLPYISIFYMHSNCETLSSQWNIIVPNHCHRLDSRRSNSSTRTATAATNNPTFTMAPSHPILDAFCADPTIVVNQHVVMAVPMPHQVPTPRRVAVVVSAVLFVVAVAVVGAMVAGICVGGGAGSHCPVVLARTKPAILPLPTTRPNVTNFDQSNTQDHVTAVTKFIRNIALTDRTIALANASSDDETLSLPEEWALYWLVLCDTPPLAPATPQNRLRLQQRYALLTLIVQHLGLDSRDFETDVSRLYDLLSRHECEWDGISCEATSTLEEEAVDQVTGIFINSFMNVLAKQTLDTIPADLGFLTALKTVALVLHTLRGTLPTTIALWTNLEL